MAIAPPVLVSYTEVAWNTTGTSKSTTSISWKAGDIIVVEAGSEGISGTLGTPTAAGLTFSKAQDITDNSASQCAAFVASAEAAADGSSAVTVTSSASQNYGFGVWVYRGSSGIGASAKSGDGNSDDSIASFLTPTQLHSALAWGVFHWNAGAAGTGVPTPSNTREAAVENSAYTAHAFDLTDETTGAALEMGKTGGGTTGVFSIVAIEIKGRSAAITGTATASVTETDIVNGGKTIIATLTGDTFVPAQAISDIEYITNALGGTTTTTSFSITLPTTQAGDILILEFAHRGTGDGTIGGTSGLTWTLKHSQLFGGSSFSGKTYWARATGNHSGQSVTGSSLTNSCAAIVTVYRNCVASGDPLSDATIVGEENASGNETQAEISTGTDKAWVVLVVVNSPDFAISSQNCTSPGTLTERAERLSTGGTDTSVAHASALKASAGATGAFTWAQTDNASGSWAYAIKPNVTTPFADARAAIAAGCDSAQSEAAGWDAKVKPNIPVANVVRTSDTVCTITLQAQADYNITAQETITVTLPASALAAGTQIVSDPTFTIAASAGGDVTVGLTGVSGTTASGSVGGANSEAIAGQAATPAITSTLGPSTTRTPTGLTATGAIGLVGVGERSFALTGQATATASGTLGPADARLVSGQTASGAIGTLESARTRALSGEAAAGAGGDLGSSRIVPLTGDLTTTATGFLTPSGGDSPDVTRPITGHTASGAIGTLTALTTRTVAGVTAVGAAGTVTATGGDLIVVPPPPTHGHWGPASLESLIHPTDVMPPSSARALWGLGARGRVGAARPGLAAGVVGVAGSGAVGAVRPSQIATVVLTLLEDDDWLIGAIDAP